MALNLVFLGVWVSGKHPSACYIVYDEDVIDKQDIAMTIRGLSTSGRLRVLALLAVA